MNKQASVLIAQMEDARKRTLKLIAGLDAAQLMGPRLAIVNPLRWEIAHAAYFYEYWVLRQHLGEAPGRPDVDHLYDSISIAHDDRWELPLPSMEETLDYMSGVMARVCKHLLEGDDDTQRDYLVQYAIFHEDMHTEAFTYTRQTLAHPAPDIYDQTASHPKISELRGDADIPGGRFQLGSSGSDGFVFDNEKWSHALSVAPFHISRTATSNSEYLEFVKDGGYRHRELWDEAGWQWRSDAGLEHPVYWRHDGDNWQMRRFDRWQRLASNTAIIHVSWHEAQAYCRWAGRRLPSELEWEVAASAEPNMSGTGLSDRKRRYPWGDDSPTPQLANLDGSTLGTIDVMALPGGDSAFGCRQMIGNAWEWTDTLFEPYPGFTPDMYQDYSQPLFGNTRVLRGGAWATRGRMIWNNWRNYYNPDRNDVFAGFRTCAL